MKIGIDARPALRIPTGVGRYVTALVRALSEMAAPASLVVFAASLRDRFAANLFPATVARAESRLPARALGWAWSSLNWPPFETLAGAVDLVHSPSPVRVPARAPVVVTLHDLFFLRHPELVEAGHGRDFLHSLERDLAGAAAIIAVSEHTRREAVTLLGLKPEALTVIHHGLEATWREPPEEPERLRVLDALGIDRAYMLAVGRAEPRKNQIAALRAVAALGRRELGLVVAGPAGPESARLEREAARLGVALKLVGHQDDAALKALYRSARALVYPSLDEGFGLPLLEAMASDLPVVATAAGAIAEVAGDAAALVEPGDEAALARALGEVLDQPARAAELVRRGRERVRGFLWSETAQATFALYQRVLAR